MKQHWNICLVVISKGASTRHGSCGVKGNCLITEAIACGDTFIGQDPCGAIMSQPVNHFERLLLGCVLLHIGSVQAHVWQQKILRSGTSIACYCYWRRRTCRWDVIWYRWRGASIWSHSIIDGAEYWIIDKNTQVGLGIENERDFKWRGSTPCLSEHVFGIIADQHPMIPV